MSTTPVPLVDQPPPLPPPPPLVEVTQQAYRANTGRGSVGPVIAVLAMITILGVIAGMIGRICTGRRIFGHGEYDCEGWVERKCSSCIDGRVDPPPIIRSQIPVAEPVVPHSQPQEIKEEEKQEEEVEEKNQGKQAASSSTES